MKNYSRLTKAIGLICFAIVFYFAGYLIGHRNLVFEKDYRPKIINKELAKPKTVDFGLFWEAWNTVTQKYVGTPDYQKMIYGAISGMTEGLGDPYSAFMEPSKTKSFLDELSGQFFGIGAELEQKDGKILVVSPLSSTPAEKAGLQPQDEILEVDGQTVKDMDLNQVVDKIRGNNGTQVKLKILCSSWDEPKVFTITREKITVKSVEWEIKPGNIVYIKVSQFGDDTIDLMKKATEEINDKKPKAVILDLRNNPGGYLEGAVDMSSLFMEPGSVVVKEKYKNGDMDELKTTLEPILKDYKTIVLVNKGSASASEIVAGALQDSGKATIVGETTFGKGSVQELVSLSKNSTLRITVAKWLTPKDRAINLVGITPDVKIDLTEDDKKASRDPQLDKALELLK